MSQDPRDLWLLDSESWHQPLRQHGNKQSIPAFFYMPPSSRLETMGPKWAGNKEEMTDTMFLLPVHWGLPSGSVVNKLPAMQETRARSLGWEDPLEKEMATHSSILFLINQFIYFNWRLITLQYCGGFHHTSTWIGHGCTGVPPHPEPPSHLPPHPIPLGCPRAPALSALLHASNLHWSFI